MAQNVEGGRDGGAAHIRVLALFGGVVKLGAERSNIEMLTALRDAGAQILLLVPGGYWASGMRDYLTSLGIDFVKCPYFLVSGSSSRFRWVYYPFQMVVASIIFAVTALKYRPTGVLCSSPIIVLNFLPALALSRVPLVYRCDDKPIRHNRVFAILWKFILWRSGSIVAVSKFIKRTVVAAGANAERVSVIYNRPPRRTEQEEHTVTKIDSSAFNIVFAGQVTENKGVVVLRDAFREVCNSYPSSHLHIVGHISDWIGHAWAREFRDAVLSDELLGDRVSFPGFVDDVPGLMERCNLNVTPTLTEEPLGNVVMEAKLAGIPSIVFPSGGLPEMISHGKDGLVCDGKDREHLANALRFYLSQPALAEAHGRAARLSLDALISNFTMESIAAFDTARTLKR